MSTNVSKQKRKDLIGKIKAIHKHIASAKQDENTHNFLIWLSEIEKEINVKEFGLVFEEHWEEIDENELCSIGLLFDGSITLRIRVGQLI